MFSFGEKPKNTTIITLSLVIIVTITAALSSIFAYNESLKGIYDKIAYQIADYAETIIPKDALAEYAELTYRFNHGEEIKDEIDAVISSQQYRDIERSLDNVRKQMELNDIYVVAYDIEVLKIDDKEAFKNYEWNPMYYIFDVYYAEDMRYPLGGKGRIVYDYRTVVLEACQRMERTSTHVITNGDWGNIITAILPVWGNGEMAVGIGVEIPMSVLDTNQNLYATAVSIALGVVFIIMLVLILLIVISTMINPITETIYKPWEPPTMMSWTYSEITKPLPDEHSKPKQDEEREYNLTEDEAR